MKHGKKFNSLGRQAGHRRTLLANMASSLLKNEKKRVVTTLAKAKALKKYVEPLITKSRNDSTHSRRTVFSYLQDKEAVKELFTEVAVKIGDRPGGYTRVLKLGPRKGDAAEMALIELVDYNEFLSDETSTKSTRRRRKKKKSSESTAAAAPATGVVEEVVEAVEEVAEKVEEVAEKAVEEVEAVAETVEEKIEEIVEKAEEAIEGDSEEKSE